MKKDSIKNIRVSTTKTVDTEGNQISEESRNMKILQEPDKFVLAYDSLWEILISDKLSKVDIELYIYLVTLYSNNSVFQICNEVKSNLAALSQRAATSYNNSIRKLLACNLIILAQGRSYRLNPTYIFKGKDNVRRQLVLELEINK